MSFRVSVLVVCAFGLWTACRPGGSGSSDGGAPSIAVNPESYDFGTVDRDTAAPPFTFVVTNNGQGDVQVTGATLTGDSAGVFSLEQQGTSLPVTLRAGDIARIVVGFRPKRSAGFGALLSLEWQGGTRQLPITGTGGGCPAGKFDVDGDDTNGCEYSCQKTDGGVELCDGKDNDCSGAADDQVLTDQACATALAATHQLGVCDQGGTPMAACKATGCMVLSGYCAVGAQCLSSDTVSCQPNGGKPAGSNDVVVDVTVSCQADGGFTAPAQCAWACIGGYCRDGNLCLTDRSEVCSADNANPSDSTDVLANVSVACQADGGFAAPVPCGWVCDSTFCRDGNLCLGAKSVPCDASGSPANSTTVSANVTSTCQPDGGFSAPSACAWSCNNSFCALGNQCLTSASTSCDPNNGNPADSSDVVANVAVSCQPDGGFTAPAPCAWACNPYRCEETAACLAQKSVSCDTNNNNPPNSTDVVTNVTINCTQGGTWPAPPACAWACAADYCQLSNTCVKKIDLDSNGVADCTENKVVNGHFNVNTSPWQGEYIFSTPSASISRGSTDGLGDTSSGSGTVTHTGNPGTVAGAWQCVPVSPSTTYTVTAQFFIPSGQGANLAAGFATNSYSNSSCNGNRDLVNCAGQNVNPFTCNSATYTTPLDTWALVSHTFTTSPTAQGVLLRLNVVKATGTTAPQNIRYDNVLMH